MPNIQRHLLYKREWSRVWSLSRDRCSDKQGANTEQTSAYPKFIGCDQPQNIGIIQALILVVVVLVVLKRAPRIDSEECGDTMHNHGISRDAHLWTVRRISLEHQTVPRRRPVIKAELYGGVVSLYINIKTMCKPQGDSDPATAKT
ncbi:hypothetical protein B0H13DRAFT_1857432 [Mycena leptocephala]|nr:hypothetical protein B0H13DRAFT_1857432 [Mycena leptocephala]